jgi:alkylated DNA repair dioxygenase AlkB/RimJ/RimL family protein N-acetyltransferase/SAM-dependent methyltransferase
MSYDTIFKSALQRIPSDTGNLEVEAIFNGVDIHVFNRIRDRLSGVNFTEEFSMDTFYENNIRKTMSSKVTFIKKDRIFRSGLTYSKKDIASGGKPNFFYINISKETPKSDIDVENQARVSDREKTRYKYDLGSSFADLTIVNSEFGTQYEVEVESKNINFEGFKGDVLRILSYYLETDIMYDLQTRGSVIKTVSTSLEIPLIEDRKNQPKINSSIWIKPVDLNFEQMKYGVLTGGDISYYVTQKTDGEHMYLIYHDLGIFMFHPRKDTTDYVNKIGDYSDNFRPLKGVILEGELLKATNVTTPNAHGKATKSKFVILDVLHGTKGPLLNMKFSERTNTERHLAKVDDMRMIIEANNSIPSPVELVEKSFISVINTPSDPKMNVTNFIKAIELASEPGDFENDGLIFIPNVPFFEQEITVEAPNGKTKKESILYKWKPFEKLSIDFKVVISADAASDGSSNVATVSLNVIGNSGKEEQFNAVPNDDFLPEHNGLIVECFPVKTEDGILYRPGRIRSDKTVPNSRFVADRVYRLARDPISIETLTGKTIRLAVKYHNRIKQKLFDSTSKKTLLDIGSGNGGDLRKMEDYESVTLVEPDDSNIKELFSRLDNMPSKSKFEVIHAGGEQTDKITGKYSVVSMMLSLSFFFGDDIKLNQICRTITDHLELGGEFIFLTINGYALRYLIDQYRMATGKGMLDEIKIRLHGVEIIYYPQQDDIMIKIESDAGVKSIVRGQIEYFVDIKKLELILGQNGIRLNYLQQANEEKFLSEDAMKYTNLYTYGKFTKVKDVPFTPYVFTGKLKRVPSDKVDTRGLEMGLSGLQLTVKPKETEIIQKEMPSKSPIVSPTSSPVASPISSPVTSPVKKSARGSPVKRPARSSSMSSIASIASYRRQDNQRSTRIDINGKPYLRIQTIADGNCFFHAVLTCCCKIYQEQGLDECTAMGQTFRSGLIDYIDRKFMTGTYFEESGLDIYVEDPQDFYNTPKKLKDLLKSNEFIGDELLVFTSLVIQKNITMITEENSYLSTTGKTTFDTSIFIKHVDGNHYESIGELTPEGIRTIFSIDYDFMNVPLASTDTEEIKNILNDYSSQNDDLLGRIVVAMDDLKMIDPVIGVNDLFAGDIHRQLQPIFLSMYEKTNNYTFFLVYFFLHVDIYGRVDIYQREDDNFYNLFRKYVASGYIKFPYKYCYTPVEGIFEELKAWKSIEREYQFNPAFNSSGKLDVRFNGKYLAVDTGDSYHVDMLSDIYQEPQRMKCNVRKLLSPEDYWLNNAVEIAKNAAEHPKDPNMRTTYNMREYIYDQHVIGKVVKECTTFSPTYAKYMYEKFKGVRVLDFSAGWGDRLLAAIAADSVERYLAYDPNTDLKPGHDEIISTYNTSKDLTVVYEPFQDALLDETFNLIFTSPPYFDLEIYKGDLQSIKSFNHMDTWKKNFLYPSLSKGWDALDSGGHMVIHIADIGPKPEDRIVEDMNNYILTLDNSLFLGMLGVFGKYVRPAWVWKKSSVTTKVIDDNDRDFLVKITSEPETMKYVGKGGVWSMEAVDKYINNSITDTASGTDEYVKMAIISEMEGNVGVIEIHRINYDPTAKGKFITVFIGKDNIRKGYAEDAIRTQMKTHQVLYADILKENVPSRKLFKKLGFRDEKDVTIAGKAYFRMVYENAQPSTSRPTVVKPSIVSVTKPSVTESNDNIIINNEGEISVKMDTVKGLNLIDNFITESQEAILLEKINASSWNTELSRRTQHYGFNYPYKGAKILTVAEPIPDWIISANPKGSYNQVIINEYIPGQGISAHIDNPNLFGPVVESLSLGSDIIMNFEKGAYKHDALLHRRSMARLTGDSRYEWKHGIASRKSDNGVKRGTRVSITYRTVV